MADITVVIPAKAGSTRLKNKNLLPFGNQDTLIDWKLSQLLQIMNAGNIVLSSESDNILAVGKKWGIRIHKRDAKLADDSLSQFSEVLHGVLSDIPDQHIAWCYVTSPLMHPEEYSSSFKKYEENVINGSHDSLVGVTLLKEYLWDDEGPINYQASSQHVYSQHLPDIYKITNSIVIRERSAILKDRYHIGKNPYKMELSKLAGIDIDYPEDYEMACALYSMYEKKFGNPSPAAG